MQKKPLYVLVALFVLLVGSAVANAQQKISDDNLKSLQFELQEALDLVVKQDGLPGATLAVCFSDGRQISLASGLEDVESGKPMPVNGLMMVGSTGKTIVSAVALQLIAEGKISLNDSVSKYFKDADQSWYDRLPNAESLTIRSLMNHTSGLPRYVFSRKFLNDLKEAPQEKHSPRECLSVVLDANPKHAVGEGWGYSDTNYLILGLVIEKVTGNSFYDEAAKRVLGPLKLEHTIPTTQSRLPGLVQGYIGSNNPFGLPKKTVADETYALNPSFEWCGGGYMASVGDLAKWMQALHGGKVLQDDVYQQLISPVDFRTGKPSQAGYGLGSFVWQTDMGKLVGHAGMMPGYLTQIAYVCPDQFAIAYQINTDEGTSRRNHEIVVDFARRISKSINNLP